MLKRLFAIAFLMLLPLLAQAQSDPVYDFGESDPVMNGAIAAARDSLPVFLRNAVDGNGDSIFRASVKVALPTEPGAGARLEHIWVRPFAIFDNDEMAGLLVNEPFSLGALRVGDRVDFTTEMISDWSYTTEDGTRYGNYTTKVIVSQMPTDEAQRLLDSFAPKPLPRGWH